MTDPMNTPPVDHGSDRYDYVEIQKTRPGVEPHPQLLADLDPPCPDCRANLFLRLNRPDPTWPPARGHMDANGHVWYVAIAHDHTCPTLAKEENR